MRDESRMIAEAFRDRRPCKKARTRTDGTTVWLHGNKIAWRDENDIVWVTLAGWPTSTTRDRINAIFQTVGARLCITQWKGRQLIGIHEPPFHYLYITPDEHVPVTDTLGMMAYKAAA